MSIYPYFRLVPKNSVSSTIRHEKGAGDFGFIWVKASDALIKKKKVNNGVRY